MASSNSPTDSWLQFYQQSNLPATSSMPSGTVSDSTVVSVSQSPSPGPHGSRPIRRRTRASRRTPTTVLNTDPTNFRAMVQQFTGGYANATSPYPRPIGSTVYAHPRETRVGQETGQQIVSSEMAYRQFLQLQLQQQQQQQQQRHNIHDSSEKPSSEINSGIEDGRQQIGSSEEVYSQFLRLQLQQQQQQQQRHDIHDSSEDAFLRDRIQNFGSDAEKNEPFGRQ